MAQTDADANRKNPQDTLKKAMGHPGRLATNKVGKGYNGRGASAASAPNTSSTSTTAYLAPAGPDPPVTATSTCADVLSESSGAAIFDGPGDLVLLG
ncbi:hypothetical protein F5883DRAFT_650007 [Diaporthe sp. PMI_573]|nr:hypothetical protein F5883DRAFT_650007 [Diaporthaceae sp. PMI_573]